MVVAATELVVRGHSLEATAGVVNGLFVLAIVVVIGRGVLRQGVVNRQSVIGAICIYLLLGMLFVFIYSVVAALGSGPFFLQKTDGTPALRMYFSFVTLTTVGYGDYTAKTDLGHILSITEALVGQLYLVTVPRGTFCTRTMRLRRECPPHGQAGYAHLVETACGSHPGGRRFEPA